MSTSFTTRPTVSGTFGAVAASHWLAAQAGMRMLELGGNAFDAAVAAGFVLQVVEPHQNGPGGEAPMVIYSAAEQAVFVVDGQGPSPAGATSRAFEELGLDLIPGSGLLAACVPGAVGAWLLLLDRFGTLSLRDVLSPAIGYASSAFPCLPSLSHHIAFMEETFRDKWRSSAAIWLQHGVPAPGERLANEQLARTYERLLLAAESATAGRSGQLEAARRAFYEGFVAEAIAEHAATAQWDGNGEQRVHRGLLDADDMARWRASLEEPVSLGYREFEVFKTGPWGQGPVLLQQLSLLEGFDLSCLAVGSPELVHVMVECAKLAFADREAFYGDPRFVDVPLRALLSREYANERRSLVSDQASFELRPGTPEGQVPLLPALATRPAEASPYKHDTCHVDVIDRFGNMVSATPSGGWLQSSPAVEGLGFSLGTRAQMFWLEEGLASSLRPRARPRTTLSPSLAFRDGEPYMVFGTPGGDQQDQWPLRVFVYHAELGLGLQEAIDTPSWHIEHAPSSFWPRQGFPGELYAESSLGPEALEELRCKGHRVVEHPAWTLGRVTAVTRSPDGMLMAAADPRLAQAYAVAR